MAKAVLGGGCFWCLEAIFKKVKGVINIKSGYAGGIKKKPSYEEVCLGNTLHAEVVEIEFNEDVLSFEDLLKIFFEIHDPTQLNRQGNDIGTQYRSIILYSDEIQKNISEQIIDDLKNAGINVVTELKKLDVFYPAEKYHQNYYEKHPSEPYCMYVIAPKLNKFLKYRNDNKNS